MDWNGNNLRIPFVSRPTDTYNMSFLYNCSFDQFPVLEMRQPTMQEALMLPGLMENNGMNNMGHDPKKKRLSNEQLEMLENSFQDEIKLEPDRKMNLAKELGLQPRQIAVWFQNRRARWKGKQLERLYDVLKEEYDAVSRDKQKLQQEVLALRAILKDQVAKKQVSTDFSGEETVESTSIPSSDNHHHQPSAAATANMHQSGACNYSLNVDDYNNNNSVMMHPYWPNSMPSSP